MKNYIALAVIAFTITAAQAQHPTHASEVRKPTRGDGPEANPILPSWSTASAATTPKGLPP